MSPNPALSPLLRGRAPLLSAVTDALVKQGYAIVPGFLDVVTCRELAAECRAFREQGEFHRAGPAPGRCRDCQRFRSKVLPVNVEEQAIL
jgi:hypothetical protein